MKMPVDMQKYHGSAGVEKFSLSNSRSAAAARRPTTAGRRPRKMFWTVSDFIYFISIFDMSIISISDGRTRANVAVRLPSMDVR